MIAFLCGGNISSVHVKPLPKKRYDEAVGILLAFFGEQLKWAIYILCIFSSMHPTRFSLLPF